MTRINVVDPRRLTDQHLVAEYRELPRVFSLAAKWVAAGKPGSIPAFYTLGTGHVRFFYDKTKWLADRQAALIEQCLRRRIHIQYVQAPKPVEGADGDWAPDSAAIKVNLGRLQDKLRAPRVVYRYCGVPVDTKT